MSENQQTAFAEAYRVHLQKVLDEAARDGLNITITRVPLVPLAMGNNVPVIHIWPMRKPPSP